jgi:hypothetical protein
MRTPIGLGPLKEKLAGLDGAGIEWLLGMEDLVCSCGSRRFLTLQKGYALQGFDGSAGTWTTYQRFDDSETVGLACKGCGAQLWGEEVLR